MNINESGLLWVSPNKEYKFIINRKNNELWNDNTRGHYIIYIDIYNNIDIKITTLVTTEIGIIQLLDSILQFTDREIFEFQSYSSYRISFDPKPDLTSQDIYIQRTELPDNVYDLEDYNTFNNTPYFSENYDEFREILFIVENYNPLLHKSVNIVSFYISDAELNELCFIIFFHVLIDLEIPSNYISEMEYITSRFTDSDIIEF